MHGAGIYQQRYGADPSLVVTRAPEAQRLVDGFVAEQEADFPRRMAELGVDEELRLADYHRLQWFDRFSLAFCLRAWDEPGEPFDLGPFRLEPLAPWRARVSPWPFTRPEVECSLVRRLVPKRSWHQSEFRRAFFELPAERLTIGFVE